MGGWWAFKHRRRVRTNPRPFFQHTDKMPYWSRYDRDEERAYEAWLEAKEAAEEAEAAEAWEAEVDENCECVYEADKQHYRYYDWDWVEPLERCAWCAERFAARAAEEAERQAAEERRAAAAAERAAAAAAEKKACTEELAARLHVELPADYVIPQSSMPLIPPAAAWRDQIVYVRERLYLLEGRHLPEDTRIRLIGEIFTFLAAPENFGIVRTNDKFRAVVATKLAEFRGDARAEPIRAAIERMDMALAEIAA